MIDISLNANVPDPLASAKLAVRNDPEFERIQVQLAEYAKHPGWTSQVNAETGELVWSLIRDPDGDLEVLPAQREIVQSCRVLSDPLRVPTHDPAVVYEVVAQAATDVLTR